MGAAPSTGPMSRAHIRQVFDPANCFKASRGSLKSEGGESPGCDALAAYSILGGQLDRIQKARLALEQVRARATSAADASPSKKTRTATVEQSTEAGVLQTLDRSLGCLLGNVVGDALGAPLEFSPVRYGVSELQGMCHDEIWSKGDYNSFGLQPGQWTDDASMALCIADSLICCGQYNAIDLRQRFYLWNRYGYNNAFGRDSNRSSRGSVGLGGNISMSMDEWEQRERKAETDEGNKFTSGNGSIMRNGAVPVWFRDDINAAMDAAFRQSKTTHQGDEAAELCRLLAFICTKFINGSGIKLLNDLSAFQTPSYAVDCLAKAECEEAHPQNSDPIFGGLENRRWDWKSPDHVFCEKRTRDNPGYIGSYAMDGMCMALHCVWTTRSFEEATLKAANLCGDSDSVCAVVGQLAGALYGASSIPQSWLTRVQRWDGGTIVARALMLHDKATVSFEEAVSDAACLTADNLGTATEEASVKQSL